MREMENLETGMGQFQGVSRQFLEQLGARLGQFREAQVQNCQATRGETNRLLESILARVSEIGTSQQTVHSSRTQQLETLLTAFSRLCRDLKTQQEANEVAWVESWKAVDGAVVHHSNQVRAWHAQIHESFEGVVEKVKTGMTEQTQSMEAMHSVCYTSLQEEIALLKSQNSHLQQTLAAHKSAQTESQNTLLASISQLVRTYTAETEARADEVQEVVSQNAELAVQKKEEVGVEVSRVFEAGVLASRVLVGEVEAGVAGVKGVLGEGMQSSERAVKDIQGAMAHSLETYTVGSEQVGKVSHDGLEAASTACLSASQVAAEEFSGQQKRLESFVGSVSADFGVLDQDVTRVGESVAAEVDGFSSAMVSYGSSNADFFVESENTITQARNEIQCKRLVMDEPTGKTPRKRKMQVPLDWVKTREHRDILSEFRQLGQMPSVTSESITSPLHKKLFLDCTIGSDDANEHPLTSPSVSGQHPIETIEEARDEMEEENDIPAVVVAVAAAPAAEKSEPVAPVTRTMGRMRNGGGGAAAGGSKLPTIMKTRSFSSRSDMVKPVSAASSLEVTPHSDIVPFRTSQPSSGRFRQTPTSPARAAARREHVAAILRKVSASTRDKMHLQNEVEAAVETLHASDTVYYKNGKEMWTRGIQTDALRGLEIQEADHVAHTIRKDIDLCEAMMKVTCDVKLKEARVLLYSLMSKKVKDLERIYREKVGEWEGGLKRKLKEQVDASQVIFEKHCISSIQEAILHNKSEIDQKARVRERFLELHIENNQEFQILRYKAAKTYLLLKKHNVAGVPETSEHLDVQRREIVAMVDRFRNSLSDFDDEIRSLQAKIFKLEENVEKLNLGKRKTAIGIVSSNGTAKYESAGSDEVEPIATQEMKDYVREKLERDFETHFANSLVESHQEREIVQSRIESVAKEWDTKFRAIHSFFDEKKRNRLLKTQNRLLFMAGKMITQQTKSHRMDQSIKAELTGKTIRELIQQEIADFKFKFAPVLTELVEAVEARRILIEQKEAEAAAALVAAQLATKQATLLQQQTALESKKKLKTRKKVPRRNVSGPAEGTVQPVSIRSELPPVPTSQMQEQQPEYYQPALSCPIFSEFERTIDDGISSTGTKSRSRLASIPASFGGAASRRTLTVTPIEPPSNALGNYNLQTRRSTMWNPANRTPSIHVNQVSDLLSTSTDRNPSILMMMGAAAADAASRSRQPSLSNGFYEGSRRGSVNDGWECDGRSSRADSRRGSTQDYDESAPGSRRESDMYTTIECGVPSRRFLDALRIPSLVVPSSDEPEITGTGAGGDGAGFVVLPRIVPPMEIPAARSDLIGNVLLDDRNEPERAGNKYHAFDFRGVHLPKLPMMDLAVHEYQAMLEEEMRLLEVKRAVKKGLVGVDIKKSIHTPPSCLPLTGQSMAPKTPRPGMFDKVPYLERRLKAKDFYKDAGMLKSRKRTGTKPPTATAHPTPPKPLPAAPKASKAKYRGALVETGQVERKFNIRPWSSETVHAGTQLHQQQYPPPRWCHLVSDYDHMVDLDMGEYAGEEYEAVWGTALIPGKANALPGVGGGRVVRQQVDHVAVAVESPLNRRRVRVKTTAEGHELPACVAGQRVVSSKK
ncbi:hypothetical protein HDU98_010159 [Podochytrium sp. JEL0797]|nr:hypothetical protein HDU98_010159 [Podochytrium sp. JEL0797]